MTGRPPKPQFSRSWAPSHTVRVRMAEVTTGEKLRAQQAAHFKRKGKKVTLRKSPWEKDA